MKIRIFQPIVPEYRVALFEGLGRKYGERIEIWAALGRGQDKSFKLKEMKFDYTHEFLRIGPFRWQKGLSLRGLSRDDVIVVCGDIHQLSSLWIAFRAKCRGIKVVWWGHHISAQAKDFQVKIRLGIAKCLSDVYLCYTDAGIDYLEKRGYGKGRVFATGNTIDLDAVDRAIGEWSAERLAGFRAENGLDGKRVLLFCGVLRSKARVDILLRALKEVLLTVPNAHLVVIGGGEKSDEWRTLAGELGVRSSITWVGELRGQDNLAPWFLTSEMFTYPGRIGLSLIHAFSFGLPVILNDNKANHGPEYIAFHPDENGIAFQEDDDRDLAQKISQALADAQFKKMGERGRDFIIKNYSMSRMVERYAEALEAAANA